MSHDLEKEGNQRGKSHSLALQTVWNSRDELNFPSLKCLKSTNSCFHQDKSVQVGKIFHYRNNEDGLGYEYKYN